QDLQDVAVGKMRVFEFKLCIARRFAHAHAAGVHPRSDFDFRNLCCQQGRHRGRAVDKHHVRVGKTRQVVDPVGGLLVDLKIVVTVFVPDEQDDEKTTGQPERQPRDVEEGVQAVFRQVAEGDFEIVFKHNYEADK